MDAIERPMRAADRFQQRWPALAVPVAIWSKFNDDQAGNLAALIAYYAFAALFPLLLVLVTVLDIVLKNDPSLRDTLLNSALSQYPVIGPEIRSNLGSIGASGVPLVIGIVFLVLGARGVAGAMQNAMYAIWGIKKEERPGFPLSQLWAFALVLTVGIGFIVTTFLSGVAAGAGHLLNGAVAHVGAVAISLILNVGVFWLSFKIATAWQVPWRELRIGSGIAAVCWQALQVVGGYVVGHQLHRASELYGVFGVVLGLLAWLFLQAEVTLYAAEADVVLARRLWPRSLLPAKTDEQAAESPPPGENEGTQEALGAQENQPAQQSRAEDTRAGDRSSLEGQPGRDDKADASGQAPVPPPRGEPSASDKKAGSAR
ncbi:MAG TPA: YihY/virulence factor BrkB family protein [Trebonia sp.]|nr:YihY/virulence factor BrkB family protein [Trebonia sp.]